jgi:hypothetical protein
MTLVVAWVAFPVVLGLICFGCGLLLEEVTRRRVPALLLMPLGLAVVIVLVQFATISDETAELGVPAAIVAAACGFGLSYPWGRIDPWAVLAPLLVFAAYAAPVVLAGEATFTGYIKLDDTATWFALTDRVMEHGRSLEGLPPSTYEATLAFNLADGYPIGAFLPLGVGRALVGQDVAWVFQPFLAFCAAMLAAALYVLAGTVMRPGIARMLTAVLAAQPALLFGYVLWGGVKEIVAAALIASLAAVIALALADEDGPGMRELALMAVPAAAVIAVMSGLGGVWLLGLLVPAAVLAARRRGVLDALRCAGVLALGVGALSAPLLAAGGLTPPTSSPVTSDSAKGNLADALNPLQVLGIWPEGDFRFEPAAMTVTYLLIAAVAIAAAIGLVAAWRRRASGVVLFVAGTLAAAAVIVAVGSPWVEAKALATASPAVVFAALVGAGLLGRRARGVPAACLALAVCGGVVWSNVLAYHEANLAPRDRHAELERIGELIAGQGPTLMTEYEPYAVRHFLRDADPEGASELRRRVVPVRSGARVRGAVTIDGVRRLRKLATAEIDAFDLAAIRSYRTLVLRRSPVESRPPSVYRLLSRGRFYDVWQLTPARQDSLLEHLPLGSEQDPSARPECARVRQLARRTSAAGAQLAVSRLPPALRAGMPAQLEPGDRFDATVQVRRPGDHLIFVGGSFRRELEVTVDGRPISKRRHRLSHTGHYEPLAEAYLSRGPHRIGLRYRAAELAPGSGGQPFRLGPLYVAQASNPRVDVVSPGRARRLCRQRLDWIESVTP